MLAQDIDTLAAEYAKTDYDKLLKKAKNQFFDLANSDFSGIFLTQEQATQFLLELTLSCLACDGTYSEMEQKLLDDMFKGISEMQGVALQFMNEMTQKIYNDLILLFGGLSDKLKEDILILLLYVAAVDKEVHPCESAYLKRLAAQ